MLNSAINQKIDKRIKHIWRLLKPRPRPAGLKAKTGIRHLHESVNIEETPIPTWMHTASVFLIYVMRAPLRLKALLLPDIQNLHSDNSIFIPDNNHTADIKAEFLQPIAFNCKVWFWAVYGFTPNSEHARPFSKS